MAEGGEAPQHIQLKAAIISDPFGRWPPSLVAMPGAPSSILAPSSHGLQANGSPQPSRHLLGACLLAGWVF